jgi:hypothetical protein
LQANLAPKFYSGVEKGLAVHIAHLGGEPLKQYIATPWAHEADRAFARLVFIHK